MLMHFEPESFPVHLREQRLVQGRQTCASDIQDRAADLDNHACGCCIDGTGLIDLVHAPKTVCAQCAAGNR
jgi:hypothetical protein